jgi:hypothetical protein
VRDKFHGETFRCTRAECGFVCDRDVNASINILLKYLTEHVDDAALDQWSQQQQQQQQQQQPPQQQPQQQPPPQRPPHNNAQNHGHQNSLLRQGSSSEEGVDPVSSDADIGRPNDALRR